MASPLDDDLSRLSLEDRRRVLAWAEDRLINAIAPLHWQLQRNSALDLATSPAFAAAYHAVLRVMAAVEEARSVAHTEVPDRGAPDDPLAAPRQSSPGTRHRAGVRSGGMRRSRVK